MTKTQNTNKVLGNPKKSVRSKIKAKNNEAIFRILLKEKGIPQPTSEYKFHPTRKWRIDYAWLDVKLALEVEGGVWVQGRHNSPKGFLRDMEKYNSLTMLEWHLIRTTPSELIKTKFIELLQQTYKNLELK